MTATRKPEVIVREIEQTRAELAETIDAITDRLNPRRAATRSARAVKEQVSSALPGEGGTGEGPRPAVLAAAGAAAVVAGVVVARKRR
ncbi:MAG TPA: DUF3618 domain-containing protein [Mycobacteriales bacterium]|nr:DUF3618 domain-containing protein [Mycobacteriales bacterium]HVY11202.1 DUF3618 domain-containing protein [Mycobacteriales bacterium]